MILSIVRGYFLAITTLSILFCSNAIYGKESDAPAGGSNVDYLGSHIDAKGINARASIGYGSMRGSITSDQGRYKFNGKSYMLDLSCGYAFSNVLIPFADVRFSICPMDNTKFNGKSYNDHEMRFTYDTIAIGFGNRSYILNTNFFISEALYYHSAFYDGDDVYCSTKYGIGAGLSVGYDLRVSKYFGAGIFMSYYGSYSKMKNDSYNKEENNGNKYHKAVGHEFVLGLSFVYFETVKIFV